jgi:hypothetical protein
MKGKVWTSMRRVSLSSIFHEDGYRCSHSEQAGGTELVDLVRAIVVLALSSPMTATSSSAF